MLADGLVSEEALEGNAHNRRSKAVTEWLANDGTNVNAFRPFWNGLVNLCGSRWFPNWAIRAMSVMPLLQRCPSVVWKLVELKRALSNRFGEVRQDDEMFCIPAHLASDPMFDDPLFDKGMRFLSPDEVEYRDTIATVEPSHWLAKGRASTPYGYLVKMRPRARIKGQRLIARGTLKSGGLTLGLLSEDRWVRSLNVNRRGDFKLMIEVPRDGDYAVTVANNLRGVSRRNNFTIDSISWIES
jgi:hypothetical protein